MAKARRGRRWRRPLGWRPSSLGKQAPGAPRERPGGRDRRREPWRPRVTGPARSPQTLSVCCVTVAARARRGFEPHGAARGSFEGTGPLRSCGLLTCVCDTRHRTPPQPARPRVPLAVLLQRKGGVRRTGAWLRASLCGGKRVPPHAPSRRRVSRGPRAPAPAPESSPEVGGAFPALRGLALDNSDRTRKLNRGDSSTQRAARAADLQKRVTPGTAEGGVLGRPAQGRARFRLGIPTWPAQCPRAGRGSSVSGALCPGQRTRRVLTLLAQGQWPQQQSHDPVREEDGGRTSSEKFRRSVLTAGRWNDFP